MAYAITDRPGYFGHVAQVYSAHKTLKAAIRAMGSGYVDERGVRRHAVCVVECDHKRKGDVLYSDMFPPVVA